VALDAIKSAWADAPPSPLAWSAKALTNSVVPFVRRTHQPTTPKALGEDLAWARWTMTKQGLLWTRSRTVWPRQGRFA
jgi:hypothetical protein